MGVGRKYDHPPLLAPGRHYMTLMDVWYQFGSFGNSARRKHLFQKLEILVQAYIVAKIPCEIWLNGSFVTEKPNPDDIDMSIMIEEDVIDLLNDDQMNLIHTTNTGVDHPDLEVYAFTRMRRSDPNYWNDFLNGARLMSEQYGMENSEAWLKGFAILRLRETNVGLRICS